MSCRRKLMSLMCIKNGKDLIGLGGKGEKGKQENELTECFCEMQKDYIRW